MDHTERIAYETEKKLQTADTDVLQIHEKFGGVIESITEDMLSRVQYSENGYEIKGNIMHSLYLLVNSVLKHKDDDQLELEFQAYLSDKTYNKHKEP